ncbi:SH3 domain-containing protein [Dehalobacterium formicoaceticum]|uniref:SH3 domain-containing protein n=1 Tax=Dehalobacterium formicoaceticum TaxID=51515 RepID=A0ABT1Y6S8_9FIRM|nr:SH3 domain-containing protein [Dehalobacterium formicoaceticum]MCR6545396.1 SH3 domain-containing protein [Dehalobacterium formicoaceticum]
MTKGRIALLVMAAVVFLSVGFVLGQIVQASGTIPGTSGDPLVAQSYVEKVVNETVADMEKKLADMESQVTSLQKKVEDLSADDNKSASQQVSAKPAADTTPKKQTPPAAASKKTVVVKGNSSVMVRTGPDTTYNKVASLLKGDEATVIYEENNWYKVILRDGQEGWVANWVVSVK